MPLHIEILYNEYNFVGAFRGSSPPHDACRGHTHREEPRRTAGLQGPLRPMLERLRQLIARLRFDPCKMGLAGLLPPSTSPRVVPGRHRHFHLRGGHARGTSRMSRAKPVFSSPGAIAREDLRRMGEDALSAAPHPRRAACTWSDCCPRPRFEKKSGAAAAAAVLRDRHHRCVRGVRRRHAAGRSAGASIPWTDILTANTRAG